jgi:RNA polymerase sigma-70 factor (ECF subfamily)
MRDLATGESNLPVNGLQSAAQMSTLMALVERAAKGDQTAFSELYEATKSYTFGMILRIVSNYATAEEVLMDTYMQAWRQAASYDPQRGTPMAWLMVIARSRSLDRLRATRNEATKSLCFDSFADRQKRTANLEEIMRVFERRKLLRPVLESLTNEQRRMIELAFHLGLTQSEIAAKLDCPLGTVKTRMRALLRRLREQLSPLACEAV